MLYGKYKIYFSEDPSKWFRFDITEDFISNKPNARHCSTIRCNRQRYMFFEDKYEEYDGPEGVEETDYMSFIHNRKYLIERILLSEKNKAEAAAITVTKENIHELIKKLINTDLDNTEVTIKFENKEMC
jgi:DNA-binding SARP family transcriptional activator